MLTAVLLLTVAIFIQCYDARRYRTCEEGCCVHEYCAYHRICYPRIHCSLGCPDGQCVGQDQEPPGPIPQPEVYRSRQHLQSSPNYNKRDSEKSLRSQILSERYSYQDSPEKDTTSSATENTDTLVNGHANNEAISSGAEGRSAKSPTKVINGICMPHKPCKVHDYCGLGHSCTFNYNLGYHVCQYNLDIGSTLCYDNKGNPALTSLS